MPIQLQYCTLFDCNKSNIYLMSEENKSIYLSKGSFPIEKATKLGNLAFRVGGSSKNQKSPKFQLGIVQN